MEDLTVIISIVVIVTTLADLYLKYRQWKTWEEIKHNGTHKKKKDPAEWVIYE